MIMSQEQAFLKAQQQLQAIEALVEQAAEDGQRINQVERELFGQLLEVGRTLLAAFVTATRAPNCKRPKATRSTGGKASTLAAT